MRRLLTLITIVMAATLVGAGLAYAEDAVSTGDNSTPAAETPPAATTPTETTPTTTTPTEEPVKDPAKKPGKRKKKGDRGDSKGKDSKKGKDGDRDKKKRKRKKAKRKKKKRDRKDKKALDAKDFDPLKIYDFSLDGLSGPELLKNFDMPLIWTAIFDALSKKGQLEAWFLMAIVNRESAFTSTDISSADAMGYFQFIPGTFKGYARECSGDRHADPFNPFDEGCSAIDYLKASGAPREWDRAIFAYNHANWYVDDIKELAAQYYPYATLTRQLGHLFRGFMPVYGPATFKDSRKDFAIISTRTGSPVVAANDARVTNISKDESGYTVVLADAHGNEYIYSGVNQVNSKVAELDIQKAFKKKTANPADSENSYDTSGYQSDADGRRLYSDPNRPNNEEHAAELGQAAGDGSLDPKLAYNIYVPGVKTAKLKQDSYRLVPTLDARVQRGTLLGYSGDTLKFEVRIPKAKGQKGKINPNPLLRAWQQLPKAGLVELDGYNKFLSKGGTKLTPEQVLILDAHEIKDSILNNPRIGYYPGADSEIKRDRISPRVLRAVAYLAAHGQTPLYLSSLRDNHNRLTVAGNVSDHSFGSAADISKIGGETVSPKTNVPGTQTWWAAQLLLGLDDPETQLITYRDYDGKASAANIVVDGHDDHHHIGFNPKRNNQKGPRLTVDVWKQLLSNPLNTRAVKLPKTPTGYSIKVKAKGQ